MPDTTPKAAGCAEDVRRPPDAWARSHEECLAMAIGLYVTLCVARLFMPLGLSTATIVIWIGSAISLLVTFIVDRRLESAGLREFRARFREKCESAHGVDLADAAFVGMSPAWYQTEWDYGLLSIEPGVLRYLGQKTSFGVRSEQVINVQIQPKQIDRAARIEVTWRPTPVAAWQKFVPTISEPASRKEAKAHAEHLASRIQEWMSGPSSESAIDLPAPDLPYTLRSDGFTTPGCSCLGALVVGGSSAVSAVVMYMFVYLLYGNLLYKWPMLWLVSYMALFGVSQYLIRWAWMCIQRRRGAIDE